MKKFKPFYYGTAGLVDAEEINRIVLVNQISIAFGIAILIIATIVCYCLHWDRSVLIPISIEFLLNASVLYFNRRRWPRTAAALLYFLQCVAIIYFSVKLGRLLQLELAVILLISLAYLIFKETWLRVVAVTAAMIDLGILQAVHFVFARQPSPLSPMQDFIVHFLVDTAAISIIMLISRPFVKHNDTYAELQRKNQFIKIFLAQITHELRTPLDNISQVTQLLRKEIPNDAALQKLQAYADIGYIVSNNARDIVNNVLTMAEIEAGKMPPPVNQAIQIIPFFEEILKVHKLSASKEGMRLHLLQVNMPEVIMGDPLNIGQILSNLLTNAVKYGIKGGDINVTVIRNAGAWELEVSNRGPVIDPKRIESIFDPFVTGRTGNIQGSGLGLYIVKSKVTLMNGSIRVSSSPMGYNVFTVSLPLVVAKKIDLVKETKVEVEAPEWSNLRVLVAEDSKFTAFLLSNILKDLGCSFSIVSNGQELLEKAQEKYPDDCPDIIILDANMPVLNGEQTIRRLKRTPGLCEVPIIVTTGDIYSDTLDKLLTAGADTYLKKPIDPQSLQNAIAAWSKKYA
jgi:two-component system, sensor histidine kinase